MEKQMTIDDFYNKYTTQYNQVELKKLQAMEDTGSLLPDDMCSFGGCMYETFGEELECVKQKENKHIWTIVDNEDGELIIIAGFHFVNRLGYLITDEAWEDEYEQYLVD
jgi:hypothetical protein